MIRRRSSRSLALAIVMLVLSIVVPSPLDRLIFGLIGLGYAGLSRAELNDEIRARRRTSCRTRR